MTANALDRIDKIEASLWEAADQLRANSKLTSSEYCMPVLGVIFLRQASNRYDDALAAIQADQEAGRVPKRKLVAADFVRRRALMLPPQAHYNHLLALPKGSDLGAALVAAMNAIEADFEPLQGQLPKDYDRFDARARRPAARLRYRGPAPRLGRRVRPHLRILPDEVRDAGRAGQR